MVREHARILRDAKCFWARQSNLSQHRCGCASTGRTTLSGRTTLRASANRLHTARAEASVLAHHDFCGRACSRRFQL